MGFKHHSVPTVDEEFHDELGNMAAGNDGMLDDMLAHMATKGGDDNDDIDDDLVDHDEYQNDDDNGNQYVNEGGMHHHQRTNSGPLEGYGITKDLIFAISPNDEKINSLQNSLQDSLQDERTNIIMNAYNTADGDEIIIDEEFETIGGADF